MNILIVDDEPLARQRMKQLLDRLDHKGINYLEAKTGEEAIGLCQQNSFDVVLLDIRMPGTDGMEVARHISVQHIATAIIFTTAYEQHAVEAFETNAVAYLLKPVRLERLKEALNKAKRFNRAQVIVDDQVVSIGESLRSRLTLALAGKLVSVSLNEIRYFRAENKYVDVVTPSASYLTEQSLKELELEFSDLFIRIHRNALVAVQHIHKLEIDTRQCGKVYLDNITTPLDVSRRHVNCVRNVL